MAALMAPLVPFLSLVLGAAAVHKLCERARLAKAAALLAGVPPRCGIMLSVGAAAIEGAGAVALLIPQTRAAGALLVALLWSLYAVLLALRLREAGRAFDCGCDFGRPSATAPGGFRLARPLALAALAGVVIVAPSTGAVSFGSVLAGFAFFALYLAAGELAALPVAHGRNAA